MKLIVVESPNKIKKIKSYVGNGFIVKASVGHFRDLPKKELGVNPSTLEESYIVTEDKKDVLKDILSVIQKYKVDTVFLASDDDREGEAIAWHLKEVIQKKNHQIQYKRIRIREITKKGVQEAISNAGHIDDHMVEAQRSRRVIDRLNGYLISSLLWEKFKKKGLSAGRVQSAILSILADREQSILDFKPSDYFKVALDVVNNPNFTANLSYIITENKREKIKSLSQEESNEIVKTLQSESFRVIHVGEKKSQRKPKPPFTTAAMQQEASQHLGFSSNQSMKLAQSLFEKGYITYHRTDATFLAEESIEMIRTAIEKKYGKQALPDQPNQFKSGDHAQEAHEAIRPTSFEARTDLNQDEKKLYDFIVKRAVASQMKPAIYDVLEYEISADRYVFAVKGRKLTDPGYLSVFNDVDQEEKEDQISLPKLVESEVLQNVTVKSTKHETKAPSRYTEKSLLKTLEKMGVGRPSTWSGMIDKIQFRNYAEIKAKKFHVTDQGMFLNQNLQLFFSNFLNVSATSEMENDLDAISGGKNERIPVLKEFYKELSIAVHEAKEKMQKSDLSSMDSDDAIPCYCCGKKMKMGDKVSKCECGVMVFKKQYKKLLTDKQYLNLITKGRTSLIKGFEGSKGSFSATLYLDKEERKVKLEFPETPSCPSCNEGKVYENEKVHRCSKCGFVIYKKLLGKTIPSKEIKKLIEGKKTSVIQGFEGKFGAFDTALVWDTNQKRIVFMKD